MAPAPPPAALVTLALVTQVTLPPCWVTSMAQGRSGSGCASGGSSPSLRCGPLPSSYVVHSSCSFSPVSIQANMTPCGVKRCCCCCPPTCCIPAQTLTCSHSLPAPIPFYVLPLHCPCCCPLLLFSPLDLHHPLLTRCPSLPLTCYSPSPQVIEFREDGSAIELYGPRTPQELGLHPRDVTLFAPLSRLAAPQVGTGERGRRAGDSWCKVAVCVWRGR